MSVRWLTFVWVLGAFGSLLAPVVLFASIHNDLHYISQRRASETQVCAEYQRWVEQNTRRRDTAMEIVCTDRVQK